MYTAAWKSGMGTPFSISLCSKFIESMIYKIIMLGNITFTTEDTDEDIFEQCKSRDYFTAPMGGSEKMLVNKANMLLIHKYKAQ